MGHYGILVITTIVLQYDIPRYRAHLANSLSFEIVLTKTEFVTSFNIPPHHDGSALYLDVLSFRKKEKKNNHF